MELARLDPQAAELLQLRFFSGLNDVIKRLLSEGNTEEEDEEERESGQDEGGKQPAVFRLIASKAYQWKDAKERYFAVLSLLQKENPAQFEHFNGFRLGIHAE